MNESDSSGEHAPRRPRPSSPRGNRFPSKRPSESDRDANRLDRDRGRPAEGRGPRGRASADGDSIARGDDRHRGNRSRGHQDRGYQDQYKQDRGRGERQQYDRGPRLPLAPEHLKQRPLDVAAIQDLPRVVVKSPSWHAHMYRKRLGNFDSRAQHGDLVQLVDQDGHPLGVGYFNPRAEITVRVLDRSGENLTNEWWDRRLQQAVDLRRQFLKVQQTSTACRLIHAEGDGFPGIVVDQFGDVLVGEAFSLSAMQRGVDLLERLTPIAGAKHWLLRTGPQTINQEGFESDSISSVQLPSRVFIQEGQAEFEVDLATGHKTGFFCDQRDNRLRLAAWRQGESLLDLCCYTGGFAIQAAKNGSDAHVTGVDLDEAAIDVARRNARRNQQKTRFVHADSFGYMRDMLREGRQFDTVVLDPPKLIFGRTEIEEGRRKYFDFNRLAMQLVAPGGLFLTCSCSGLMTSDDFMKTVASAVPPDRRAQVLDQTGPSTDHPVATNCPESSYLKALWLRIW
ncbi:MAG: class I SAM-dependent methyltransferase [Planctomycetaceae bacterium]